MNTLTSKFAIQSKIGCASVTVIFIIWVITSVAIIRVVTAVLLLFVAMEHFLALIHLSHQRRQPSWQLHLLLLSHLCLGLCFSFLRRVHFFERNGLELVSERKLRSRAGLYHHRFARTCLRDICRGSSCRSWSVTGRRTARTTPRWRSGSRWASWRSWRSPRDHRRTCS